MNRFQSASFFNDTDSERQPPAASQPVKPLPPLPRGWPRIRHETGLFLRGIGLGIVVTFFRGIFTKDFLEPEKVAIRRSRITALLRTLIHVVPVGVAIFEVVLNLKGHFVGKTFDKQSYLQFIAKAHEIAMQASLATIILSYIRHQISTSKGMPFGAFLSGLQFLQVSYLWSVELWSSILSKDFQVRRKTCFAGLVLVCITVAATAGPSSASLLIARQGTWPIASTYLAVNTTVLDLWPDRIDGTKIQSDCAVARLGPQENAPRCPISENLLYLNDDYGAPMFEMDPEFMKLISYQYPGDPNIRYLSSSICQTSIKDQICATIPQTAILPGFFSGQMNHSVDDVDGYQVLQKDYYQPYTIASCLTDSVKDASDQAPLRFPRISETDSELKKDREIFSIPGLTKGQMISSLSGDDSDFHVDWIDLPMDVFNTGIPGAVIVNSQNPKSLMRNITTCTLNAGWGSSAIMSSSQEPGTTYSHMSHVPSSTTKIPRISMAIFLTPYQTLRISQTFHILNDVSVYPRTGWNFSTQLLYYQKIRQESVGLSDTGTVGDWEAFSDLRNATSTCDNCLVFEVEYSYYGWLYSGRGTATVLAITVMLAYCVLVLGHIIYSAIFGVSSTAWDSTAEIVALAMNSSPTKILQNTCAGIIGRHAFNAPVRVLVTAPGHLELVFGEDKDQNAQTSKLEMNKKYGKLTLRKTTKMRSRSLMRRVRFRQGLSLVAKGKGGLGERSDLNAQVSVPKRAVFSELEVRAGSKRDQTHDIRAITKNGTQSDANSFGVYRLTRRVTD